ncbi:TetR family transcriptional regulator [Novosphingobium sp. BL-8H]|uniref:TetR/AcrR family transcriptional regulator n=1 Tax=Novosphingobium sp. BL-8H TaxID=3127640 RepID=UPI0037584DF4
MKTRAEILQAAVEVFGELGYAQAGLRDIAAKAGTASSLPVRYFGTKAALFEAALIETIRQNSVFAWDKARFGETMARLIHDRSNVTISVMLIQALSEPESRAVAAKVWRTHMIAPLEEWLGPPGAQARANNLFAMLTGVTLQVHGLASGQASPEQMRWVAETLQSIVDADCPDAQA